MRKKILLFIIWTGMNQSTYSTCTLDFSGAGTVINFGSYNPFSATAITQSLSFVSNCSSTPLDADRTITISVGSNLSLPNRAMNGSSSLLNYNLYVYPGYSSIWGDGTSSTVTVLADEINGETQIINAQIPAQQNVTSAGTSYTDSVFVAVGGGTPQMVSIQANVPNTCTFSGATLSFGTYDPLVTNLTTPLQATTTINVECTSGATGTINVGMENGLYYSSGKRRLLGVPTGQYLNYNLYLPSSSAPNASCSYSIIWGTTTGSLLDLSSSPPSMLGSTYNICGQIDAGQTVGAGLYSDSVTMDLNY